jgi:hypothetical protein
MITRGGVPLTRLKRPPVSEAIDQGSFTPPGALMLFTCRAAAVVPELAFVSDVIRRYRKSTGSCRRKLNPGQQSLLVLVYLCKGETFAGLAAGLAVGVIRA